MPARPQIVIVVESGETERFRDEPAGVALLNRPDLMVVETSPLESDKIKSHLERLGLWYPGKRNTQNRYDPQTYEEVVRLLDEHGLLRAGERLVRSPYDPDHFATVLDARMEFALEKYNAVTLICKRLGAVLVEVEQLEIKTQNGTDKINLSLKNPTGFEAQATHNKELAARMEGRLKVKDRYSGGSPDVVAANELVRKMRLSGDKNLWALIEARSGSNLLKEREQEITLTEESTSTLEAAAQLKVPGYSELKFTRDLRTRFTAEYRLTYRIVFDPELLNQEKGK